MTMPKELRDKFEEILTTTAFNKALDELDSGKIPIPPSAVCNWCLKTIEGMMEQAKELLEVATGERDFKSTFTSKKAPPGMLEEVRNGLADPEKRALTITTMQEELLSINRRFQQTVDFVLTLNDIPTTKET
tara:strand:+ start:444 stop:839 length:396 start_codon:yes stop_codon:yes gene_type:complete